MKSYFLKTVPIFLVYVFSSFCMESMQNEEDLINYEKNIREKYKDFISEITYLKQASIFENQLRLEKKSHNELDRVTIYYYHTADLLEKSKILLESLNGENIPEDIKKVKKIVYDEIYQLALSQFNKWEKWYQMEKQLSSSNTRGGHTFNVLNNKR